MPFTILYFQNDEGADIKQSKINILGRNKNTVVSNGGRLALGEVSNNLVKNEIGAANKTE